MKTKIATRPRLQRDDVVARAMEMADADGLEAVTIRRLAHELGVTPMALYWHFADKDALLMAVSERLWTDVAAELAVQDGAGRTGRGWEELKTITTSVVAVLRGHPGCAGLAWLAALGCPAGLDMTERALSVLESLGVPADRLPETANYLLSSSIALVDSCPGAKAGDTNVEEHLRSKRIQLASLPPERYPHVAAMAAQFVECPDVDRFFDDGVEFVVGGIRTRVPGRRAR